MDNRQRILVIDPEGNRGRLLVRRLEREGVAAETVADLSAALAVERVNVGLVLLDLSLLCGPERERLSEIVAHFATGSVWECPTCGRRLLELTPGSCLLSCCGAQMVPTSAPAAMRARS